MNTTLPSVSVVPSVITVPSSDFSSNLTPANFLVESSLSSSVATIFPTIGLLLISYVASPVSSTVISFSVVIRS